MYQSVQGFSLFKRATARRINKGVEWRSKVIVIHVAPKHSPIADLSLKNKTRWQEHSACVIISFGLSGSMWDRMEITTSDSQTKHFDIALLREKGSKWWRPQHCAVYFSVGMGLRALTWWFLPTPINYLDVPLPLRHIIRVLYRYNNVARCIAMPRPYSHD